MHINCAADIRCTYCIRAKERETGGWAVSSPTLSFGGWVLPRDPGHGHPHDDGSASAYPSYQKDFDQLHFVKSLNHENPGVFLSIFQMWNDTTELYL